MSEINLNSNLSSCMITGVGNAASGSKSDRDQVNELVINLLVDRRQEKREKQLKWTALFWVNSSGPGGGSRDLASPWGSCHIDVWV